MTKDQDQNLCIRCLRGDRKAQKDLYENFRLALYTVCLRYASNEQEAQDMLQEGFVKIFRDLGQYDSSKGALWTWMRRVMVNASLQYLRRCKKFKNESYDGIEYSDVSGPDLAIPKYTTAQLLRYLQELPPGYRTVFNLHVMEGYAHAEIAEILDISINTSKSQLAKGKALLRKWLRAEVVVIDHTKIKVAT